jgi:hypothetical protein
LDGHILFVRIQSSLDRGDLVTARSLVHGWLNQYLDGLCHSVKTDCQSVSSSSLLDVEFLQCLGDVVERTSDPWLLECLWQGLERLPIASRLQGEPASLPLLGVPILNRFDLLERLVESIDFPVHTLAIVDNSGSGLGSLSQPLQHLATKPHPSIGSIRIAQPFNNLGVSASWNQILRSFPESPFALLANNDVVFTPGLLAEAVSRLNPARPQFMPLLPGAAAFSAFLITAATWDRIGLFSEHFYPAYFEDLDYRDRIREDSSVEWLDDPALHMAMQADNVFGSATISSDPILATANSRSFQVNRLWYLSRRRLRHSPSGQWLRRWLCDWPEPSVSSHPHG